MQMKLDFGDLPNKKDVRKMMVLIMTCALRYSC